MADFVEQNSDIAQKLAENDSTGPTEVSELIGSTENLSITDQVLKSVEKLSADQEKEIEDLFNLIDKNNDKELSFVEFRDGMMDLYYPKLENRLCRADKVELFQDLFIQIDVNRDGSITLDEFKTSFRQIRQIQLTVTKDLTESQKSELFGYISTKIDDVEQISQGTLDEFLGMRIERKQNSSPMYDMIKIMDYDSTPAVAYYNFNDFCLAIGKVDKFNNGIELPSKR